MAIETASYISQLEAANPPGSDRVHQGDDHIRLIKSALKNTFPNVTGAITLSHTQINALPGNGVPFGVIALWYGTAETVPAGWALCNGTTVPKSDGSGTITTPDPRDRALVAAGALHAAGSIFGVASQTLTTDSAGGHTHVGTASSAGEHNHGGNAGATTLALSQVPSHSHFTFKASNSASPSRALGANPNSTASSWGDGGDTEYIIDTVATGTADAGPTNSIGGGGSHTHSISSAGGHVHDVTVASDGGHSHALAEFSVVPPSMAFHLIMKI